ncbi:hypothetical protein [uncultured Winogradskyella sp.]|uniref:hypothetical protein n=1 Tax=uncultured Winogradskyella sp. TaxID=395353 RepID=UPI0026253D7F|nr:hypothetical protein [uncultured Winogradskyella sp.]
MNKTFKVQKSLIIFMLPLLIIASMILLTRSSLFTTHTHKLSLAITIDLLLITPFIYFLLIRKTTITKTTIVPFIILGVVVCSIIIPTENQYYLTLFKTWILPVIELFIFSFVVYNILKARRLYKLNKAKNTRDFFTILKSTCNEILPKAAVIPFVTEIAVFYYGFINWKKTKLKLNEFSYHKDSGTIGLLIALIFLIAIETVALHLLLERWNTTAAWIFTGISIYSGIQILGFLKSMTKRPFVIEDELVYLRYGIMNETTIKIQDIESIELSTKDIELNKTTRKLSFLGNLECHNLLIKLKNENSLVGLYGIKRQYTKLALYVDKKQDFKNLIEQSQKGHD